MGKVVAEISISLDGYVAGPNPTLEEPLGRGGELLHEWVVRLKTFKELHGMQGGDVDTDDEVLAEYVRAQGAVVMGRGMFSGGEGPWEDDPNADAWWGDDPPFRVPVFVVTHHPRKPVEKQGGTTFTFVTEGVEAAVERARAAVGSANIQIAGGASVGQQALRAGLVDELQMHLVPVLLGEGTRLLEGLSAGDAHLERVRVVDSRAVTHLWYRIVR